MAGRGGQRLPSRELPEPDGTVASRGGQHSLIVRVGERTDTSMMSRGERPHVLRCEIPEPNLTGAGECEGAAVGREGRHPRGQRAQLTRQLATGRDVPDPKRSIGAGRREAFPIG